MDLLKNALSRIQWNRIEDAGKQLLVTNIMNNPQLMAIVFNNLDLLKQLDYNIDDRGCLSHVIERKPIQQTPDDVADMLNIHSYSKLENERNEGPFLNGTYAPPNLDIDEDIDYEQALDNDEDVEEIETNMTLPNVIPAVDADQLEKIPLGKIKGSLNRLVEIIDEKKEKHTPTELELKRKAKIERIVRKTNISYSKELYPYQINHVKILINALWKTKVAIDASDTGTGKTHCALIVAKNMGYNCIIMCPKPVIAVWSKASDLHHYKDYPNTKKKWYYCANYEQFKGGNTPFLKVKTINKVIYYKWKVPPNTMVIVDECHKFKNYKTQNFIMIDALNAGRKEKIPILLLSATLVDKLQFIYPIGRFTNLFSSYLESKHWIKNQTIKSGKTGLQDAYCMNLIHEHIFPKYGSRMRIAEIGDMFPENNVIYEPCTTVSDNKDVDLIYKKMLRRIKKIIKSKGPATHILTQLLRARQASELTKVAPILEMTEEYLEEGYSVVIFVNFNDTLEHLAVALKTDCIVSGENPEQRDIMIAKFQSDKSRVILCNIQSGGVGISLHDINGKYPRRSIMVPSWSATDTKQCLGRIWRAGGKSKCVQKILYCPNSIEETIVGLIKEKLSNIDSINNGSNNDIFNETMKKLGIALNPDSETPETPENPENPDHDMYENVDESDDDEEKVWNCIVSVDYVKNIEDLDIVFTIRTGGEGIHIFPINDILKLYLKEVKKGTNDMNNILTEYGIGILKKKHVKKMSHKQYLSLDAQYKDSTNQWYAWNDILNDNYNP